MPTLKPLLFQYNICRFIACSIAHSAAPIKVPPGADRPPQLRHCSDYKQIIITKCNELRAYQMWNSSILAQHTARGPHVARDSFSCGREAFLNCRKCCKSSISNNLQQNQLWPRGKLLNNLPAFILLRWSELARIHFSVVVSHKWRLKNGVPQGSFLEPLLFNINISDLPNTVSRKFACADDLAIMDAGGDRQARGTEQRHGNHKWIPSDLETKAQHYTNGVGNLPT